MKRILLSAALLIFSTQIYAATFSQFLSLSGITQAIQTSDGKALVLGSIIKKDGTTDPALIKLNVNGDVLFGKRIVTGANMFPGAVLETDEHGFLTAGVI